MKFVFVNLLASQLNHIYELWFMLDVRCQNLEICVIIWFLLFSVMVLLSWFSVFIGSLIMMYASKRRDEILVFVVLLRIYLTGNCELQLLMCSCGRTRSYLLVHSRQQLLFGCFLSCLNTIFSLSFVTFRFWFLHYCFCGPMLIPLFTSKTLQSLLIYWIKAQLCINSYLTICCMWWISNNVL